MDITVTIHPDATDEPSAHVTHHPDAGVTMAHVSFGNGPRLAATSPDYLRRLAAVLTQAADDLDVLLAEHAPAVSA